ncbi:maleylpyruvate isomerase family mycothiol-dependent enzyme [Agrococcus sediminis]|uniref:maleylpyruvate isomerase family mycothiol-dependent enzyme n=1 Tax=Agrococcus sediminis TaxID=2599924 RepID=UPI00341F60DD
MATDGIRPLDHLAALADWQAQFLETLRRADPATPIPWLAPWTVEKLVVHLARVHHWAAGQARRVQEEPLGRGPFDLPELYAACALEVREALAGLDPDARAWALVDDGVPRAEHTGTVRFWHRRQALETLVHLWDLRTAIGEPLDVDAGAWIDCLDELVTVMHPRQLRLGRVEAPAARLVFAPTETDARLALTGSAPGAPEVVLAGPARSLALLAWGRVPLAEAADADGGIEVRGDRALAVAVLRAGLAP